MDAKEKKITVTENPQNRRKKFANLLFGAKFEIM